jgi:GNAT superfamily N-acetyltransferase
VSGPFPAPLGRLPEGCDLDGFSCGEPELDRWLREEARRAEGRTARTFVVCEDGRVVAYYCIAAGQVERSTLPRRIRQHNPNPVPVFVLGRLAVDVSFQGRGLGIGLVRHCFRQCLAGAMAVGTRGLVVHPLDDRVAAFYQGLGLAPLPGGGGAMMIAIGTIADAVSDG